MKPVVVFTGGGTAGHVNPNIALIAALQSEPWNLHYIGSHLGPEAAMIKACHIPFHAVSSGKLRRYFSWQNFLDPFKILRGIFQSWRILRREKATLVFSKGGFVGFPVVVAAWIYRIPIIVHESDFTPGLANRLSFPFAHTICLTFQATEHHFKDKQRLHVTGTPIREGLDDGVKGKGMDLCGFRNDKPCLLLMGGSQGAAKLNQVLRAALPELLEHYQVIHICGRGNIEARLDDQQGYCQFDYVDAELPHLYAAADLVVSRAGANALYELLALNKPHLLIPLSAQASRGDQIQNARHFEKQGVSYVINEAELDKARLIREVDALFEARDAITDKIKALGIQSGTKTIAGIIKAKIKS